MNTEPNELKFGTLTMSGIRFLPSLEALTAMQIVGVGSGNVRWVTKIRLKLLLNQGGWPGGGGYRTFAQSNSTNEGRSSRVRTVGACAFSFSFSFFDAIEMSRIEAICFASVALIKRWGEFICAPYG